MSSQSVHPRRSCLYMPGANARALEKAAGLPADVLLLDLEDAVAPEAKVSARDAVCAAVTARPYGRREAVVRINGLSGCHPGAQGRQRCGYRRAGRGHDPRRRAR